MRHLLKRPTIVVFMLMMIFTSVSNAAVERRRDQFGKDFGYYVYPIAGEIPGLGTAAGASQDRYVWMPLTTWERVFGAPETLQVFARARDTSRTTEAERRTRTTMRARRRLQPGPDRGRGRTRRG